MASTELITYVKADVSQFETQVSRATKSAETFTTKASGSFDALNKKIKALGIATAAYLVIKNFTDATDRIGKLNDEADKIGIAVEQLQSLSFAASKAGVSAESLQNSFAVMQMNMGKALEGTKAQIDAFNKLGLSAEKLSQLSIDEQFREIAAALKEVDDASVRAAISQDIFGKGGKELGGLIKSNIDEATEAYERLGLVLSKEQVAAVDEMGESFELLGKITDGVFNQIIAQASPALTELANAIAELVVDMGGIEKIAKPMADAIVEAANIMTTAFKAVGFVVDSLRRNLDKLALANVNRSISKLEENKDSFFNLGFFKKKQEENLKILKKQRDEILKDIAEYNNAEYNPNAIAKPLIKKTVPNQTESKLESILPSINDFFANSKIKDQALATAKATDSLNNLAEAAKLSAKAVGDDAISRGLAAGQGLEDQIGRIIGGVDKKDVAINSEFDDKASRLVSLINAGNISAPEIESALKNLSDMAKGEAGSGQWGGAKDNTAMLYAIGELRKYAKDRINLDKPVEVNVTIEADADGVFRAIVKQPSFTSLTSELVKNVAAKEARMNAN